MSSLNDAMDGDDLEAIRQALCDPRLQLENFEEKNLTHYVTLLQKKRAEKAKVGAGCKGRAYLKQADRSGVGNMGK